MLDISISIKIIIFTDLYKDHVIAYEVFVIVECLHNTLQCCLNVYCNFILNNRQLLILNN